MRCTLIFLIAAITGCSNPQNDLVAAAKPLNDHNNSRELDSIAAVTQVREFFKAFDAKDVKKIDSLWGPSMKVIHHNGATTNTAEMIRVIEETKDWWPRTRKLSDFEFIANGNLSILGLKNEVTFSLPDGKKVYEPYIETWVFERSGNTWIPVRCHYSKITVEKHSEEVK